MKSSVPSKGLEWTNVVLGATLFGSAATFADVPAAVWNAVIMGTAITWCSLAALKRYSAGKEWLNITFGSWTIVAPFALGFGTVPVASSIHIAVGVCVCTVAAMQIVIGRAKPAPARVETVKR